MDRLRVLSGHFASTSELDGELDTLVRFWQKELRGARFDCLDLAQAELGDRRQRGLLDMKASPRLRLCQLSHLQRMTCLL